MERKGFLNRISIIFYFYVLNLVLKLNLLLSIEKQVFFQQKTKQLFPPWRWWFKNPIFFTQRWNFTRSFVDITLTVFKKKTKAQEQPKNVDEESAIDISVFLPREGLFLLFSSKISFRKTVCKVFAHQMNLEFITKYFDLMYTNIFI